MYQLWRALWPTATLALPCNFAPAKSLPFDNFFSRQTMMAAMLIVLARTLSEQHTYAANLRGSLITAYTNTRWRTRAHMTSMRSRNQSQTRRTKNEKHAASQVM